MKLFKLPSGTSYFGDQKIVTEETLGTFVKLEELVNDTKKELESIKNEYIEKQSQELEKKKEEAYLEALTIFNQHVFALDAEMKTLRMHLVKQVLPLALNAAKKIVGEQLKMHPETIVAMIQKQLNQCTSARKIKILVSKEDNNNIVVTNTLQDLQSLTIIGAKVMGSQKFNILSILVFISISE